MANTIKLTLEVDDEGLVKIQDFEKKATKSMENVAESTANTGETGRLAFFAMGEGAENAAQSMGVPNQVARQLGTTVEGLASRMGGLAVGFGMAGLAAMAVVGIWKALADRKRELAEATAKNVAALQGEVAELYKNRGETERVRKAKYDLLVAKQALLRLELAKQIIDETQALAKQRKELAEGPGLIESFKQFFETKVRWNEQTKQWESTQGEVVKGWQNEKSAVIGVKNAFLELLKAQFAALNMPLPKFSDTSLGQDQSSFQHTGVPDNSAFLAALARQADFNQARFENLSASEASFELIHQAELESFDAKTRLIMMAAQTRDEAEEALAIRQMQRATMVAEQERATNQMRWQAAQQLTGNLASGFQQLYQLGGKHARKYFTMYKIMSIAEATISGTKAVLDAYAFGNKLGGPVLGGVLATAAGLVAAAKIAAIKKQEFDGGGGGDLGGGGDGGGTNVQYPSAPAAPAAPAPDASPYAGLTINIDGQRFSVQDLLLDMAKETDRQNGAYGGFSVSVSNYA